MYFFFEFHRIVFLGDQTRNFIRDDCCWGSIPGGQWRTNATAINRVRLGGVCSCWAYENETKSAEGNEKSEPMGQFYTLVSVYHREQISRCKHTRALDIDRATSSRHPRCLMPRAARRHEAALISLGETERINDIERDRNNLSDKLCIFKENH